MSHIRIRSKTTSTWVTVQPLVSWQMMNTFKIEMACAVLQHIDDDDGEGGDSDSEYKENCWPEGHGLLLSRASNGSIPPVSTNLSITIIIGITNGDSSMHVFVHPFNDSQTLLAFRMICERLSLMMILTCSKQAAKAKGYSPESFMSGFSDLLIFLIFILTPSNITKVVCPQANVNL